MRTIAINKRKEKICCETDFQKNTITFPLDSFLDFANGLLKLEDREEFIKTNKEMLSLFSRVS